jgi:hypothetical protein
MGFLLILINGKWQRFYGTKEEAKKYIEESKKWRTK